MFNFTTRKCIIVMQKQFRFSTRDFPNNLLHTKIETNTPLLGNELDELEKIHFQEYEKLTFNQTIRNFIQKRFNHQDVYQYYTLLNFIVKNLGNKNYMIDYTDYLKLISYMFDNIHHNQQEFKEKVIFDRFYKLLESLESSKLFTNPKTNQQRFKYLFKVIQLLQIFNNEYAPIQTIEKIINKVSGSSLGEEELVELITQTSLYLESTKLKNSVMPQEFWNLFIEQVNQQKDLLKQRKGLRRQFMLVIQIIYPLYKTRNDQLQSSITTIAEIEHQELQKYQMLQLSDFMSIIHFLKHVEKNTNNYVPSLFELMTQLFKEDVQKRLDILFRFHKDEKELNIHEILSLAKNNNFQIRQELRNILEGQNLYQIVKDDESSIQQLDMKLANLLKDDRVLKELDDKQKSDLKNFVLKIFGGDLVVDRTSFRKLMVLMCRLWPNDIKMVQLAFNEARQTIKVNESQKQANNSLAVNALFQMEMVQYNIPSLQKFFLSTLVQNLQQNKDLVFSLKAQEISAIFFYISKQEKKLQKKELLAKSDQPQFEGQIEENKELLNQLLAYLIPHVQYLCSKNVLRLKVLFTIIDCYCKYFKYLRSREIDFKYLFEKIESNLMSEIHMEIKQNRKIQEKDIGFLYSRIFFLKVGSRKLQRFLKFASYSFKKKIDNLKTQQKRKTTFYQALKNYRTREQVYRNMQRKRSRSMFAYKQ